MLKSVDILFSDYVPDRGGAPWTENPGYLVDAVNVRFTPNGYRSSYLEENRSASASALSATALAARGFANTTTPRHYVGTASKLFESDDYGATWNDNSSAAYTASDWDIAIFGTYVIAVNISDNPQYKLLYDAVATNFADLAGSPPKAARVARIRDSLVLGEISTDLYGLRWSSIGDPTDWPTPGSATALARQAGSTSLQSEYGIVTRLVGGEKFGFVFQERAITRMTYVGGDIQFTFDVYERENGTGFSHSAIRVGSLVYFLNSTGVHVTDGYKVTPLSLGKIDEAMILGLLSYERAASLGNGVAYDHRTRTIFWSFTDPSGDDFLLGYDIPTQQFRIVDLQGTMLDGTLYSVFQGEQSVPNGFQVPHCIGEDGKLKYFHDLTGVPTQLRTGFVDLSPGEVTEVTAIEVLGASIPAAPTISVRSETDTTNVDLSTAGYYPAARQPSTDRFTIRKAGRYHSFQYVDSAQSQATLVRGLRVYYETRSAR